MKLDVKELILTHKHNLFLIQKFRNCFNKLSQTFSSDQTYQLVSRIYSLFWGNWKNIFQSSIFWHLSCFG